MTSSGARPPRRLVKPALAILAGYHRAWTMLLDQTSAIVFEIGTRDLVLGGVPGTTSIGRRIAAFVHPDDIPLAMDKMEESLAVSGSDISFTIRAGDGRGPWRLVAARAVNLLDHETVNGILLAVWTTSP